jgi:hypothetical protein
VEPDCDRGVQKDAVGRPEYDEEADIIAPVYEDGDQKDHQESGDVMASCTQQMVGDTLL